MPNVERHFVEVIRKLDELRFCEKEDWAELGRDIFHGDFPADSRVLLFWLCSAIDQFYPYTHIWTKGEKAMLELITIYEKSFNDVAVKIKDNKVKLANGASFTLVRDYEDRLRRTFNFLGRKYSGSLSQFLAALITDPKIQGSGGTLKFTYFISRGLFDHKEPLNIDYPKSYELEVFKGLPRKRVWMFAMFLRREPPVLRVLQEALIETLGKEEGRKVFNIWINPSFFNPLDLQMPSDMWNTRLFKALGPKVGIKGKNPKKEGEKLGLKYGISPSAFDVTFSIGADRCSDGDCVRCPFGDNNLCHKSKEKDCNVLNWLHYFYDYKYSCNYPGCPIGKDFGKGLCSRQMDDSFSH